MSNVGKYVVGDEFWGCEDEMEDLLESLRNGSHVHLLAQRRMGKTSLMREAETRLQGEFYCLQVDLERCLSAEDAIVEFATVAKNHRSTAQKAIDTFSNIFTKAGNKIEELEIADFKIKLRSVIIGNWQLKADDLLTKLSGLDKPLIIFIDELPILVNRILKGDDFRITPERRANTDIFMSWLRSATIQFGDKIRFVICGSIGIEPILRQAGLSATLNTFTPLDLPAWSDTTAEAFLLNETNSQNILISKEVITYALNKLGYFIPHHVQMFLLYIERHWRRNNGIPISEEIIDTIYSTNMLGSRGHVELATYEDRLKMVVPEEIRPLAMDLLTETAVTGKLASDTAFGIAARFEPDIEDTKEAIRNLLNIFEHDGYLTKRSGAYFFLSKLLRDWWKGHFELGYTPFSEK